MIKKILEIKGIDFLRGLSYQPGFPLGGRFQLATHFNPWEQMGYLQPSYTPVEPTGSTVQSVIKNLLPYADGDDAFVLGIGDHVGGHGFYQIDLSDNSLADLSSALFDEQAFSGNARVLGGAVLYKNYLVYSSNKALSMRAKPIIGIGGIINTPADDKQIINGTNVDSDNDPLPVGFVVGSNGTLYYTANRVGHCRLGKIDTVTSIGGVNTNNAVDFAQDDMVTKDVTSDGYYVVAIADTNPKRSTKITTKCKVFFWDKFKNSYDVGWDIPDRYLIAVRFVRGAVHVIGYSGIWVCNAGSPPKLAYPLLPEQLPAGCNQVDTQGEFLIWAGNNNNAGAAAYAYGALVGQAKLFNPYSSADNAEEHTSICSSGDLVLGATDKPTIYIHNAGGSRGTANIKTSVEPLGASYRFAFAKVILKKSLTNDQSLSFEAQDGEGNVISYIDSRTYDGVDTAIDEKRSITFRQKTIDNPAVIVNTFEDLVLTMQLVGAEIERITVYGTPQSEANEDGGVL